MKILKADETYINRMETVVMPWLEQREFRGVFERVEGQPLVYRKYTPENARGRLVLLHGFTEGIDKFRETAYYFAKQGLEVWLLQQREHGKSFRSISDLSLVYLENYQDLVEDLHYFVKNVVCPEQTDQELPLYLFGHSMGGGVATLYLEQHPEVFTKAILSSPMLELFTGTQPLWVISAMAKFMIGIGKGKDYLPGSGPFRETEDFEGSCTNCYERYIYWFRQQLANREYRLCAPAIRTAQQFQALVTEAGKVENIKKIITPVLLFQAGKDNMVKPGGQDHLIEVLRRSDNKTPSSRSRLVRIESAKHEIYLCKDRNLEQYWGEILKFVGI